MLITAGMLERFSGVSKDMDETQVALQEIYIESAQQIITDYVGYDPETAEEFKKTSEGDDGGTVETYEIPGIFRFVCLEIASLIQLEEGSNLGYASSSDAGGIGRTFLNVTKYDAYLQRLSSFRKNGKLEF